MPSSYSSGSLPAIVYAQASPHSIGGRSLFDADTLATSENVGAFHSEADVIEAAVTRLQEAGFEVLQVSPTTINIAGSPAVYEAAFGTKLATEERTRDSVRGEQRSRTFVVPHEAPIPGLIETRGTSLGDVLEGVAIEEPVTYFANAFPPSAKYWHLDVPADVSLGLNADLAHRSPITGRAINVAMVDTGWYRHPYFTQRGYRSAPVVLAPGAANPDADEYGHGTGESANIFAAAPDVNFTMVKQGPANATAAFNAAVALNPHIISCSWGWSIEFGPLGAIQQAVAAAIATAVANGIVVVFSAGNGHYGFPGAHPDVISAGGTYLSADGSMQASDYASGFASQVYPGRNVPDVCGLVGMLPKAAYIMLPVEPGDTIDADTSGGVFPDGDETTASDGWGAFSGTSAAAPQIAGVCALLKEACPKLTPADIKDILKKTARDVTTGKCQMGNSATVGPDLATGFGLVDAQKAVLTAKVRCMGPIKITVKPVPITIGPVIKTIKPILPIKPIQPIIQPIQKPTGVGPVEAQEAQPGQPLTDEDISALEDLIVRGDADTEV